MEDVTKQIERKFKFSSLTETDNKSYLEDGNLD